MLNKLLEQIASRGMAWRYRSSLNRARTTQKPRILFCVNSLLMYAYVDRIWQAYRHKNAYDVYVSPSYSLTRQVACLRLLRDVKQKAEADGYTYLPALVSVELEWQLLIAAEPVHFEGVCAWKRLMTDHSVIGFKRYNDDWYPYLHNYIYDSSGGFRYDTFLEASPLKYDYVTQRDPKLQDLIEVVGSLHVDDLLEQNAQRDAIRQSMGYAPSDRVLLVQSTYRESLVEDFGEALLIECNRLAEREGYHVIISLHPHLWTGAYAEKHPWGQIACRYESDRVRVRRPSETPTNALIASDIALTDHTSHCINFALLGKPMLFYLPRNGFQTTDVLQPLLDLYPRITSVEEIGDLLVRSAEQHDPDRLANVVRRYVGHPGQATERINAVLDQLLSRKGGHAD